MPLEMPKSLAIFSETLSLLQETLVTSEECRP
jgi:hypothetical protein